MGQSQGNLSKTQLKDLQGVTKQKRKKNSLKIVSSEDIKQYHKFWFELYPSGEMTKEGFKKFSSIAMPEAPQDSDIDYLFRAMDQNKDGTITFKEFLFFQSITAPSSKNMDPEDLINSIFFIFNVLVAFEMYDEDGDGYVTETEMIESLTNMFKAKNINVTSPEIKKTIVSRVNNIIKLADENGDRKLTREEILKACKKDPSLLVMI